MIYGRLIQMEYCMHRDAVIKGVDEGWLFWCVNVHAKQMMNLCTDYDQDNIHMCKADVEFELYCL